MSYILSYFSYSYIRYALLCGVIVSLAASLLGVSLVLKRYSMIGDGLSHVGFGVTALAAVLNISNSLWFSIPIVIVAALFLLRLNEKSKLKGDAAIALVATSALAFGYIISSLSGRTTNVDVCTFLFGNLFTINPSEVLPSIILSVVVILAFLLLYNKLFLVTFDENFATATGVRAGVYNVLIATLTSITIVVGMKIMGTLLISALIVFPALTSMRVCKSFKSVVIAAGIISVTSCFVGVLLGVAFDLPGGSVIVLVNLAAFIVFSLVEFLKRKKV